MEMSHCRPHHIKSLIGSVKAVDVYQVGRHTPLSTANDLFDGMRAGLSALSNSTISHIIETCECFLFSSSLSHSRPSYSSTSPPDPYFIATDTSSSSLLHLPSHTAECVGQALDPFQHAVQFMRLLLQKLDRFHFHPEHRPHSCL